MYPKVAVLLAAYNGLKYLPEQLESIYSQVGVQVDIYLSVDASSDGTEEYIASLAIERNNVIPLRFGSKFGGAAKNFFHLIRAVDFSDYDYVSLADQDDIWESDKLEHAIRKLNEHSASCYSGSVTAFWENGRSEFIDKAQNQRSRDYLFEAAGPGCTYVFNRDVMNSFKHWLAPSYNEIAEDIALHDWLLYAFARSQGERWFIDPEPKMLYRQHANNQVGTNNNIKAARKRLQLIKSKWYRHQVIHIVDYLQLNNEPIAKYGLKNGYLGNLYLLLYVYKLRRRLRDRWALAAILFFNIF
ncbi:MAG: glycosyltransferase [Aeromonas sobria]